MTSALRGREGVDQNVTIVLIGCVNGTVTKGGEGVQKSEKFVDVISVSPLGQMGFLGTGCPTTGVTSKDLLKT